MGNAIDGKSQLDRWDRRFSRWYYYEYCRIFGQKAPLTGRFFPDYCITLPKISSAGRFLISRRNKGK
jgi:hypothetical protein